MCGFPDRWSDDLSAKGPFRPCGNSGTPASQLLLEEGRPVTDTAREAAR